MSKPWLDALQKIANGAQPSNEGLGSLSAVGGTATPDLSTGTNQRITLTGSTHIAAPANYTGSLTFRLILEQDGTGGHALTFDSAYVDVTDPTAFSGANAGANTRVILTCLILSANTIIFAAPIVGPVPIN